MKVLMFGWEFPPMSSGGLGTACYGLTKGLSNNKMDVTFVLPYMDPNAQGEFVKLVPANQLERVHLIGINSLLEAYSTPSQYETKISVLKKKPNYKKLYGKDLHQEVVRFSYQATIVAQEEDFDVIHCHDWLTFLAGIKAKEVSGKPLIVHVHATEFDRTGGHVNQLVYDLERKGMHAADHILAVSQFTKNKIVEHYGIEPQKVTVVHNAVELTPHPNDFHIDKEDKLVLFLGRITIQKGPDYFIRAAKACLDHDPHIRFVIAGTGDMEGYIIEKAAEMGIGDKVLFAGFLTEEAIDRMYRMADVYVMPSVSEPFGITPLEAMKNGTPVIISKQSGVSEVIKHCLKVDFWDVNQLADRILAVLNYRELHQELKHHGSLEIQKFSWNNPARACIGVYHQLVSGT